MSFKSPRNMAQGWRQRMDGTIGTSGGSGAPWWMAAGVTPLAVYQGKGAASYAASKINLANPGTYDLTEGVGAVPWTSANGWDGDGTNYFLTGIVPVSGYSMFAQYSNANVDGSPAGVWPTVGNARLYLRPTDLGTFDVRYASGSSVTVDPNLPTGNLGVCGQQGYRNGVAEGALIGAWDAVSLQIGLLVNWRGFADKIFTGQVAAVIIYSSTLTAPQAALIAAAMAAL